MELQVQLAKTVDHQGHEVKRRRKTPFS